MGMAAVLAAFALSGGASSALAASCQTGTYTFTSTGAEQCYTVPSGTTWLYVAAVGAPGGSASDNSGGPGGFGAVVTGYVPVQSGQTLYVEVGATGSTTGVSGGWNGGGSTDRPSGGGGGASDVRLDSCATNCGTAADTTLDSRLIVAGGGGGGDFEDYSGGAGGVDAFGDGGSGVGFDGGGGGGGTASEGGAGGSGGYPGSAGSLGIGGASGADGGGGGGGYYGGGGGGATVGYGGQGSGGGGSSFAARFVADATIQTDTTGVPEVAITPVSGPQYGPTGPQGATGPQGPVGATGPQGPTGASGGQGPAGPTGATGQQGNQGNPGQPGQPGATGPTGPKGATGPTGPAGPDRPIVCTVGLHFIILTVTCTYATTTVTPVAGVRMTVLHGRTILARGKAKIHDRRLTVRLRLRGKLRGSLTITISSSDGQNSITVRAPKR
jgi:hypothetical protein